MATVYPGPAPQPTIVTAQPNQMMQVQIEADKEDYNFFGVSRGKHTFDVMASAAHMPAQLRAYITPEEYESAFAMSNKLKQEYFDREKKLFPFILGSLCLCLLLFLLPPVPGVPIYLAGGIPFVGVTVYKILVSDCQRNEDRFGEPFKQWEKNGLKVNYSGAHGGSKNVPFVPPVVRVQFPTE